MGELINVHFCTSTYMYILNKNIEAYITGIYIS